MIAITKSDFEKFGCPNCGCDLAILDVFMQDNASCAECGTKFICLLNSSSENTFSLNNKTYITRYDGSTVELSSHPRKGLWPHSFVALDIRPKGIDGEFWDPIMGIENESVGAVKTENAGNRILNMIRQVIGRKPESWLHYHKNSKFSIRLSISDKDGFDLKLLSIICRDQVITKDKLIMAIKDASDTDTPTPDLPASKYNPMCTLIDKGRDNDVKTNNVAE